MNMTKFTVVKFTEMRRLRRSTENQLPVQKLVEQKTKPEIQAIMRKLDVVSQAKDVSSAKKLKEEMLDLYPKIATTDELSPHISEIERVIRNLEEPVWQVH